MSKDLPYFKFFPSEWLAGDIMLEEPELQGLFIAVCSYYWCKQCTIETAKLFKRFKRQGEELQGLFNEEFIEDQEGYISIKFLDRQWQEREAKKATLKANGQKGGRPKKKPTPKPNENQKVFNEETKQKPKGFLPETNKEEEKEEDKEKDKEFLEKRDYFFEVARRQFCVVGDMSEYARFCEYWSTVNQLTDKMRWEEDLYFINGLP